MRDNEETLKSSDSMDDSESSDHIQGKKRKLREMDTGDSSVTSADRGLGLGLGSGGGSDRGQRDNDDHHDRKHDPDASPPEPSAETKAKIWETLENDYRDTSHISEHEVNARVVSLKRQQAFPATLHRILSSEKYAHAIVWMPHGRAWKVIDQKVFKKEVLPSFFNHCSTSSFMRQVNNWNFTRVLSGPDEGAYYHQYFLRGLPHICLLMTSKSHSKSTPARSKKRGPDILARMLNQVSPDFYAISERHPLPASPPAIQSNSNSATSSLATSTDVDYTSTSKSDAKLQNQEQDQEQSQQKPTAQAVKNPDNNGNRSASQAEAKAKTEEDSPRKHHSSSSDESHSFSSSTIPPKSSSSFSTEEEKNGNSSKSPNSSHNNNKSTTAGGSSATKGSETQSSNNNNLQAHLADHHNDPQGIRLPPVPIEGRMINFDGSGITLSSAGILFGGYTMNQYLAQNQYLLSRSLFFHPAINNNSNNIGGANTNNNAGTVRQRINPAVAYPLNTAALPAFQGTLPPQGTQGLNGQTNNGLSQGKKSSSGTSSSDNSY